MKGVLPNNFANPDLDKQVLGGVVDIFTNMDMGEAEESQDLLGRTYEYGISQFAEKEGKGGGEFYTPSSAEKNSCFHTEAFFKLSHGRFRLR